MHVKFYHVLVGKILFTVSVASDNTSSHYKFRLMTDKLPLETGLSPGGDKSKE